MYGVITAKTNSSIILEEKKTSKMWISNLMDMLHLERIRFAIQNKLEDFNKIWHPLVFYLANQIIQLYNPHSHIATAIKVRPGAP